MTAVAVIGPSTAASSSRQRVAVLDRTKGVLVVCMVIYHSFNYSTRRELGFQYLAFLPPSFILISGFLLSNVYLARHSLRDWRLHLRLLGRGLRLLALFTLLNVLVQLFIPRGLRGAVPGLTIFWEQWFETYVSGNGRLAVFEVLLPIAYLLLLAPALLWADRTHRLVLPALTLLTLTTLAWWEHHGFSWLNPNLVSVGLIGMLLGRFSLDQLQYLRPHRLATVLAYGACAALAARGEHTFLSQTLGAVLALAMIYSFCLPPPSGAWLSGRLELLGRYSLVAYIGQIGILQILSRAIGHPEPASLVFGALLVGTLLLTAAAVELLDALRRRSTAVSGIYHAVFS